jgi:DNA-binding response OmpR family regulator
LIILDEKLSDELGTDTCKRLKRFEHDMKVLHTSGLGKSLDDYSFECGCNEFLPKPFRVNELAIKVKDRLEDAQK